MIQESALIMCISGVLLVMWTPLYYAAMSGAARSAETARPLSCARFFGFVAACGTVVVIFLRENLGHSELPSATVLGALLATTTGLGIICAIDSAPVVPIATGAQAGKWSCRCPSRLFDSKADCLTADRDWEFVSGKDTSSDDASARKY